VADLRTSRKDQAFQQRQQDILAAAISLFENEPNWEQVTVAQIAQQADIGKGTVYKHFSSKEDIYARLTIDFHCELMDRYKAIDANAGCIEFMHQAISLTFTFFQAAPLCGQLSEFCQRQDLKERVSSSLVKEFEDIDKEMQTFFRQILEKGIADGVVINQPIDHLMIGLEATFQGAVSMMINNSYQQNSELDENTFVEAITRFMLSGLAAK
jgi:AcrR family transcriptional regulator